MEPEVGQDPLVSASAGGALTQALSEARSGDPAFRARAGRRLALDADQPTVLRVLRRLLRDADDAKVTRETAETLRHR